MDPSELTFENYWALMRPDAKYNCRYDAAKELWEASPEKQETIIRWLKQHGTYSSRNPYFFIHDWQVKAVKPQIMSFNDYYARYNTTEEREGWKMANPTGQQVIYVKAG